MSRNLEGFLCTLLDVLLRLLVICNERLVLSSYKSSVIMS